MGQWKQVVDAGLFHAQCLLRLRDDMGSEKPMSSMFDSSVALQLIQGWRAWLNELASFSQYRGPVFESLQAMTNSELSNNPELQALINLKQDPNSWVSRLCNMSAVPDQQLLSSENQTSLAASEQKAHASQQITLVNISHERTGESSPMAYQDVLEQFKQHVLEVRARQIEW